MENLGKRLAETDDWGAALKRYSAEHRDYYGKRHKVLSCGVEVAESLLRALM